jgi:hypothetical protein
MKITLAASLLSSLVLSLIWAPAWSYPLYGSEDRGIRRLEGTRLAHEGVIHGRQKKPGETLALEQVDLRLLEHRDLALPEPDPAFSRDVRKLLGGNVSRYGIAVLDLTDPSRPRYAESGADVPRNPGSVGKMAIGLAVFQALADAYPDDIDARMRVLRETEVTADDFIIYDSHKVRFWNPDTRRMLRRPLQKGDQGTLFEFLDWMLSASSNAAASMTLREALLLHHFGANYPPPESARIAYLADTPKNTLRTVLADTLQAPLTRNGLDTGRFRQGSFFTRTGKSRVPGTNSYGTAREMMRFLLRMEQGRLVDEFSSRELKRLLYMTERRIRYASSPALNDSAVYFKSGSLYACQEEPGYTCKKYAGNKMNLMNSVAIVETPAGEQRLHYIVTLNSNVLKKNSAVDHQTLATRIHRLIAKDNDYVATK